MPADADPVTTARIPGQAVAPSAAPDPLDHPDPRAAADAAAVENLLRCWVRESDTAPPDDEGLRIALHASRTVLRVPVRHWSATGWHRFGRPVLEDGPHDAPPVDAVTLAALLSREAAYHGTRADDGVAPRAESNTAGAPDIDGLDGSEARASSVDPSHRPTSAGDTAHGDSPVAATSAASAVVGIAVCRSHAGEDPRDADAACADVVSAVAADVNAAGDNTTVGTAARTSVVGTDDAGDSAELVGRVADSTRRIAAFLTQRRSAPADPDTTHPFLSAEQSLLLGHPFHPTPKSREGLSDTESHLYSPESRGSFPLHWIAVDRSLLAGDSAWTERGRAVPAEQLALSLAGKPPTLPDNTVPLPLHPWQAREIRNRPAVTALLDAGLLHDLGAFGEPWHPTSSVRTVYRPGAPAMLKLSLGLRITNSRRENLRKELHRGVEVHRLMRTGLTEQLRAVFPARPGFDIVRDPAWLAVDGSDGEPLSGLDVVIRHNPFGPGDDAVCLAGLTSPRPWPGDPALRSRLAEIVSGLAARTGRPTGAISAEWFLRYLHTVVRPMFWLDGAVGIALEAHQQNTLVLLDPEGWPVGGRFRDNQGYYFRESRRDDLQRRLAGLGEHSDTFVPDAVVDERFDYYLGINNILGLIGAFGAQRLADERLLLAALRGFLTESATGPETSGSSLPVRFLDSPTLRCKANMLTRLRGMDELVGPVDTQSVYVSIPNPLVTSTA